MAWGYGPLTQTILAQYLRPQSDGGGCEELCLGAHTHSDYGSAYASLEIQPQCAAVSKVPLLRDSGTV